MDSSVKSLVLPLLNDSNFDEWVQTLHLIAYAQGVHEYLEKDENPASLKPQEQRSFYTLCTTMVCSLSERARAIAVGSGAQADIVPFRIFERLQRHFTPVSAFNDLQFRRKFYSLRYSDF